MTIETATYISQLDATYPASGDQKMEGDNHIRLLKSTIKATFPNVTGVITTTHTELNYVDGVTSAIQTQIDAKAATAALAASSGSSLVGHIASGTGATARTVQTKLRDFATVEDYGATGGADDTTAFNDALAANYTVACMPGRTYTIGDVSIPTNCTLDLRGAIIVRKAGAQHTLITTSYRCAVVGGELQGSAWVSTTTSGSAVTGASVLAVTSATGLVAGMRVFYPSSWADGGIETNEIASIAGTNVTLSKVLRGNVSSGVNFLADFALIKSSGGTSKSTFRDLLVTNFLVGVQSGANGVAGGNAFTNFDGILFNDFVGAGLVVTGNVAAEDFSAVRFNGGKTQTTDYTGDGVTVRFAIPYKLAKKCYRWGTEPSIRLIVNSVQLTATTDYTLDLATMEVVCTVAPAAAAAVQIQNYEYAAFGIVGQSISATSASSIERVTSSVILACNVGQFYDGCELGFLANVQSDTCGYCATLLYGCGDFHFRATDHLYSPFGIIIHSDCSNMSISGFSTSLLPDAAEFSTTASKTELTVRAGATNIQVDYTSWTSKNSHTLSVGSATYPTSAGVRITPTGIAVAGSLSGLMALYGTSSRYAQVTAAADQFILGGGSGFKYVHGKGTTVTLQVGAPDAGGVVELTGGSGVRLRLDGSGRVLLPSLPTSSAGLPSGSLWSNANVVTIVP